MYHEYVSKDQMVIGQWYRCSARNFTYGMWTGTHFRHLRYKFGQYHSDYVEYHWDDGPPYGTVKPYKEN